MDLYPDRRFLLQLRDRPFDNAEGTHERHPNFVPVRGRTRILMRRLVGRHAVIRVLVVWVIMAVTLTSSPPSSPG